MDAVGESAHRPGTTGQLVAVAVEATAEGKVEVLIYYCALHPGCRLRMAVPIMIMIMHDYPGLMHAGGCAAATGRV